MYQEDFKLDMHLIRSLGVQKHFSLSPPQEPFSWMLEKIIPMLIAKIAIKRTNSVIKNKFITSYINKEIAFITSI